MERAKMKMAQSLDDGRSPEIASLHGAFALRGIRFDRVEPGLLSCSFTVPPHLTDRNGNLASGEIANLVEEIGSMAMRGTGGIGIGKPFNVSVDINISFLNTANVNDELEITSRVLGHQGGYPVIIVLMKNKRTGDVVAEGRHSLLGSFRSKL